LTDWYHPAGESVDYLVTQMKPGRMPRIHAGDAPVGETIGKEVEARSGLLE
jgi:hypothetical protein